MFVLGLLAKWRWKQVLEFHKSARFEKRCRERVFYVQKGQAKVTLLSDLGKERWSDIGTRTFPW